MIDIRQNQDGDIDLTTGDLTYTESTCQHQRDILLAGKGHFKESPAVGVYAAGYTNDENPNDFLRSIRKEFTRDGMKVKSVQLIKQDLEVDAQYP